MSTDAPPSETPPSKVLNLGVRPVNGVPRLVDLDDGHLIENEASGENIEIVVHGAEGTVMRFALLYTDIDAEGSPFGR